MKRFIGFVGAMALGLGAAQAVAAINPADREFAMKAAAGGEAEVALGRLATENAASTQVREFGQRMITDHTQANHELDEIARRQELTLPAKPTEADQTAEERLRTMKGHEFDVAYMRDMVQDHRQDIADFRKEADSGQDPALKAFAQKYLPVLEKHLQMAEAATPK